jgi:hypothetical protein
MFYSFPCRTTAAPSTAQVVQPPPAHHVLPTSANTANDYSSHASSQLSLNHGIDLSSPTSEGQTFPFPATSLGVQNQTENDPSNIPHRVCTTYDDDEEMESNYGDDSYSVDSRTPMSICAPTEYADSDREEVNATSEHALSEYDGDDDGGSQLHQSEHDEEDSPLTRFIRYDLHLSVV